MENLKNILLKEIVKELTDRCETVATMESCTGGGLANSITNIPGASQILKLGIVTYSNEGKIRVGKVPKEVIDEFTVYSVETAMAMAREAVGHLHDNYGVGITGQLCRVDPNNPYGASDEVHVSVYDASLDKYYNKSMIVTSDKREENKEQVIYEAVMMLLQVLKNTKNARVVFASNNKGKLMEVKAILESQGIKVLSLKDVGVNIDPEETGKTFSENALIKAKAVYHDIFNRTGNSIPVIADDSGLCIETLGGFPGVNTKRFASGTDHDRNKVILELLKNHQDRSALIKTAIGYYDGNQEFVRESVLPGIIANEEIGQNGFGYDSIFIPTVNNLDLKSLAQMSSEEKNIVSPRGIALRESASLIRETLMNGNKELDKRLFKKKINDIK